VEILIKPSDTQYRLVIQLGNLMAAETVTDAHAAVREMYKTQSEVEKRVGTFINNAQLVLKEKVEQLIAQ